MTLPAGAVLEAVLPGGIAIYDVSNVLPQPKRPRFNKRPHGVKIVRVFFHHSGAYGKDGFVGVRNSVNYVINKRNFGARPYHFWLAYKPDIDEHGNIIIYRLAKDEERCWHTGNVANDNGIGCVWQGNLHPKHDGKPSEEQYRMAEALTAWLIDRHNLSLPNGLSFHAEAKKWGANKNKPSCPGPYVKAWVVERRERQEKDNKSDKGENITSKPEVKSNKKSQEKTEVASKSEDTKKNINNLKSLNEKPAFPRKEKSWFEKLIKMLFFKGSQLKA